MVTFASYRKVLPSMLKFLTVHSALRRNWMYASNMVVVDGDGVNGVDEVGKQVSLSYLLT